jgi:hypothetical protein
MELKDYLQNEIGNSLKNSETLIKQDKKALKILESLDIDNADYVIGILSCWSGDGEKNTLTNYKGSLKEAIQLAERQFKKVNKRSDIQGYFSVQMRLGEREYFLPEEYWKGYRSKK